MLGPILLQLFHINQHPVHQYFVMLSFCYNDDNNTTSVLGTLKLYNEDGEFSLCVSISFLFLFHNYKYNYTNSYYYYLLYIAHTIYDT